VKEHKKYVFNKIDKLNGIIIGCIEFDTIKHGSEGPINLYIRINDNHQNRFLYTECFKTWDSVEDFKSCIETINALKFSKMTGQFETNIKPEFDNIFENITMEYKECCVCLENTLMSLKCEHHICYECKSQLKKQKCPLCRVDINYYDDDDESDEEE
jgi:hypothetical protein